MVEKVDGAQVAWLRGLKGAERQAMRERANLLDRLSATGIPDGPVRVALLVGEAAGALDDAVAVAYDLALAGQIVWLYTHDPLPTWISADFHDRVRHFHPDPELALVEQLPPAELFITPDVQLLASFYKAQRSLLYWHQPGRPVPDGWSLLPARILTTGMAGMTLSGRPAFPVAPGAEGWAVALAAARHVVTKDPFRSKRTCVSLCMIVKNEEKHLQDCLLSAYGVADEICIVDTGSSDRTVAIARRMGARVEHREWRNDFAWARNEALAMATGDWVLQLDADEVVTPELRREIPLVVARREFEALLVPIESILPRGSSRSYGLRLFRRRPEITYGGIIHESVGEKVTQLGVKAFAMAGPIRHLGYTEDPMLATGKRSRNRGLLLKALESEPNNPRYSYYMGVEDYLMAEPEAALRWLESVPHQPNWVEGEPAMLLIHVHRLMGEIRKAFEVAREAVKIYPRVISLWIALANMAYGLGEQEALREALEWLVHRRADGLGDAKAAEHHTSFLLGCLAPSPEMKESHLRRVLPAPIGARALMRHWVRTDGLAEAIKLTSSLEVDDRFAVLLQALADLQDWPHLQMLLEMKPELRNTPATGSLYLAQGRPQDALAAWQASGGEGWHRYAVVVAFLGGGQMLTAAQPYMSPIEWLAVQDIVQGKPTWRWAIAVPWLCNINNPLLLEQLVSKAPFLAEAINVHLRLNVLP